MLGLLLSRDHLVSRLEIKDAAILQKSKEESYVGVYFNSQRIGYVKQRLQATENQTLQLSQEGYLKLNILGKNHPVNLTLQATLADNLLLKDFTFHLDSPFYVMDAQGEVKGKKVLFTMDTGKEKLTETITLKNPPFIATQHRSYLLHDDLTPGKKFKVPFFDPVSMAGKESIIEYKGQEKLLIRNRIQNLHHFVETFSGVRINLWLDDQGKVIKEESPAGFVFLAEPEFIATAVVGKGDEILGAVSIVPTGPISGLQDRTLATYQIEMNDDLRIDDQRQQWQDYVVTISLEKPIFSQGKTCKGHDELIASDLFIQADHHEITALAATLIENTHSDHEKVKNMAQWVYENLEKRPVIGLPDALTTLRNKRGDCNEHASLFAALARSQGIPTKIVAGVTLQQEAFYYHAWNEVCIDDRWISIDTTRNQIPADVTHIKFVEGGNEEMIRIASLIGNLKIEVIKTED